MSAARRTSVVVVGGLVATVLAWVPAVAPAHAEPVTPTYTTTDFATGVSPISIAVGDLDGDGDQDLVTADSGASTVTVLTRGAAGDYTPAATVSTVVAGAGYLPTSVAIGDLDGDGDQDLVTSNVGGSVTALTRESGGTYTASIASLTGAGSYSVAIGDLDGDGDQDLVTANRDADSVSVLTRGPGGSYTRTDVGVGVIGSGPMSVAIGDLDGDGDQDLATANADSDEVSVLTRGPGGAYTSMVYAAGDYPVSVAIGDLDGDGDQDLATANALSDNVTVLTRGSSGEYTSTDAGTTGTGSYPYSVAVGDVDGDGDHDLATANGATDSVAVLTRGAGGEYTLADAGATGIGPVSVAIADLDRDGDQDLVTANTGSDNVTVLTNTAAHRPPNSYASSTAGSIGGTAVSVAIGDLDADGDQDLAIASRNANNVTVLTRGPDGAYTAAIVGSTGATPYSVAIGDLDGDGDQDLATANYGAGSVTVLTRGAGGTYTSTLAGTTGSGPQSVAIGDLDGDGDQDIATANRVSHNVTVLTRGAGGTYTSTLAGPTGSFPSSVAIGDLDGDGDQDLATANASSNNVTVLTRGAGGGYTYSVAGTTGTGTSPASVAIGDLDGDGDQDLATANENSDNVAVLTRGAGGTYTSALAGGTGDSPVSVAVGDLDGDGDQDLATANYGGNSVTVLTRGADGTYTSAPAGTTGSRPFSVAIGDLDGDGDQDLATANWVASNVTVLTALRDEVPPTSTDDVPSGPRNAAVPVTLTATDTGGSGIKEIRYAVGTSPGTPTTLYDPASRPTLGNGQSIRYFAVDNAGNAETAHTSIPAQVDTTRPTVTLTAPTGMVNGAFTVTATFSETVTGLTASDFTVGNGTASALTGSGDTYAVTVTPAADGSVTVDLPAGSASDSATNPNTAATQLTRTADLTRPTVTLSAPTGPVNGTFTVTATFSEAVTGLAASSFAVDNGAASDLTGSGDTYTVTITPAAEGAVTVDLPAGSASDAATNTSTAAIQLTRTADVTRPTVTLSAATGPVNGAFTVTATFSEAVTGLAAGDFTVTNGAASDLTGSGDTYTVTITPAADGQVAVDLPAAAAADSAGNPNTAATQLTRTADLTRPSVTLSAPTGPVTGPFTVTATFSESVTGLAAGDFTVTNGAASDLAGSGTSYTVTITPTTTGQVTVDLPAESVTDAAGNPNLAATQLTRTAGLPAFTTGPDATITGTPVVGGTLTAATEATTPAAESYSYAWSAGGTVIPDAVGERLTLDVTQLGQAVTVTVTATRTGYVDVSDTSEPTTPVAPGTFVTGPTAAVSGSARVGQTLTATPGAPAPFAESVGYAWYADDVAITGETGPRLTLTAAQAGRRISVEVTARRAGYADAVSRSVATDPVATDQAPQLALDVTVAKSAGRATDGIATVRRRSKVTITWSASADATVTATGELGELLTRRYPGSPIPTSGQVTVKLKRLGLHRFQMQATRPSGTTSAYAAVTVVRARTRLRVEGPRVARAGQKVSLRVTGLGGHERYRITLTGASSRRPLLRTVTGRTTRSGAIHRRLLVPDRATGKRRIIITVTGRTTHRTASTTIRLR